MRSRDAVFVPDRGLSVNALTGEVERKIVAPPYKLQCPAKDSSCKSQEPSATQKPDRPFQQGYRSGIVSAPTSSLMRDSFTNLTIHPISRLKSEDFTSLLAPDDEDAAFSTFLLPMEKKGVETRKNPIVFKNALKRAQEMVERNDCGLDKMESALRQLDLPEDAAAEFWQNQQNGLALVVSDSGEATAFKTPFPMEEFVWVGKRPRLGRLMPLVDDLRFYILALDLNELRLFEATRWDVHEIELEHGPTSLDEAMKYDDPEKSLQHHSAGSSPGGEGKLDSIHHGQGGANDSAKTKNVRRYMEMVDKSLADNFPDHTTPLVLFGPDSEVGHFREICSYPHLHEDDIRFNPSNQSDEELNNRMLNWVGEQAKADAAGALETLQSQIAQNLGSSDFDEVIKSAFTGRVETLFVKKGATRYGTYDEERHAVSSHANATPEADDDELIEAAVMRTAAAGGRVRYLGDDELPKGADIAAIYRY